MLDYANSLRMEKKYSQAISQTIKALKIKPDWGEAYLLQGNIYVSGAKSVVMILSKQLFIGLLLIVL